MMWIEILSHHGDVWSRVPVEKDEARVGRAFDNDVVIDDPHVAPHHLRIHRAEDGELVAEDLGTLNGLYAEHGAHRVPRLSLAREPGFRIGRTTLRVRDAAHPVAPEKLLTPPRAHAAWAGTLGAVLLLMLLVLQWLTFTSQPNANAVFMPLLGFVTGLALWTSLWSVLSRIFFGQAQFALMLRIAVTVCIALVIWDQVTETASFSLAWREAAEYSGLGAWALLGAACYGHLHAIGPKHMRAAMGLVIALVIAGAALQYFGRSETRRIIGQRASLGDLRPPSFRVVPLASADAFFQKADGARARVDKARTKEPSSGLFGNDLFD
ncbi:MAG TPA: FHA domain-containing protein [Usitatibacter sp.]|nr:FHA domain-containing protein [Usitatibacter sp.]